MIRKILRQDFEPQDFKPQDFEPQDFKPQDFEPQDFDPQDFEDKILSARFCGGAIRFLPKSSGKKRIFASYRSRSARSEYSLPAGIRCLSVTDG